MALVALGLIAIWMTLVVAARGIGHARADGTTGLQFADRRGSPQWWARALGTLAFLLLVLAPVAELLGLPSVAVLDQPALRVLGVGMTLAGVAGTVHAQSAMGSSWRGDVDPDARTTLVTTGPFRVVRNPVLACTQIASVGIALLVPNVVAVAMLVVTVISHEIQVRSVEEPYLLRVHGDAYRRYAERTGQFIPGVGRSVG